MLNNVFTFPFSYIYNKSFRLSFHAIAYFILQLLPHYKHRDCCFKILSILHDTNMLPITYLSISLLDIIVFYLSYRIDLHLVRPDPHAISYFILHGGCPIMNKGAVVTKYCFILLVTKMVPIAYY